MKIEKQELREDFSRDTYWTRIYFSSDDEKRRSVILVCASEEYLEDLFKVNKLTKIQLEEWLKKVIEKWEGLGENVLNKKVHYDVYANTPDGEQNGLVFLINEILEEIKPEDIKKRAERFDFYTSYFKGLGYTPVRKIDKDEFKNKIEKDIDNEKIEKIKENFKRHILRLNEEKQKDFLSLPKEKIYDYIVDSVSGTTAVTPFQSPDFLNRGGIVYPKYDQFLKPRSEIDFGKREKIQSIKVEGNNNVVNAFIVVEKKEKLYKKTIIKVIVGLIIAFLVYIFGWI